MRLIHTDKYFSAFNKYHQLIMLEINVILCICPSIIILSMAT